MTDLDVAGEKYGQFAITKVLHVHELNCILRELVHLPTGAQVIHIGNDDPENLFCLSFAPFRAVRVAQRIFWNTPFSVDRAVFR